MADTTNGYADAVVALATAESALDVVDGELQTIAGAVDGNNELRDTLADPNKPLGVRLGFVESQVLTAAHPVTRAALAMVIAGGRASDLVAISTAVAETAAEARNRELAEVRVAAPLSDAQREKLRVALEEQTGRSLDLRVIVDETVVGGVVARVGDTVIDGSIAKRLSDVRARLAG